MADIDELAGQVTVRVEADLKPLEEGLDAAREKSEEFDREVAGSFREAATAARDLGGEVKGSAAAAASGFDGAASSAKSFGDTVEGSAAAAADSFATVKDATVAAATSADELSKSLHDMWEGSTVPVKDAAGKIGEVREALSDAATSASTLGESVSDATTTASGGVDELKKSLADMWGTTASDASDAAVSIDKVSESATKASADIGSAADKSSSGFSEASKAATEMGDKVEHAGEAAKKGLEDAASGAHKFGDEAKHGFEEGHSALEKMIEGIEAIHGRIEALIELAEALGIALIIERSFDKFIEETEKADDAVARLATTLRSVGPAAGQTLDALNEQAESLSKISTFSKEAVNSVQGVLLTFNNIRGENFERATKDVVDLASSLGRDLPSAARLVGIALQDPERGFERLRLAGVLFSEAQKEVIKDMIANGDVAKAQAVILGQLEHSFAGTAAALRDTLGGALTGLKNDFDAAFIVGEQATGPLRHAINSLAEAVADPAFKEFIQIIGTLMFGALTIAVRGVDLLIRALDVAVTHLEGVSEALLSVATVMGIVFAPAVFGAIVGGFAAVAQAGVAAVAAITAAMIANPLGAIITGLAVATVALYTFRDSIKEALGIDIIGVVKETANVIIGSFRAVWVDLKFLWNNFSDIVEAAMIGAANTVIRVMTGLVNNLINLVNDLIHAWNQSIGRLTDKIADIKPFEPPTMDNSAFDRLSRAVDLRNEAVSKAMNTDYLGSLVEGVFSAFKAAQRAMTEGGESGARAIDGASKLFKTAQQGFTDVSGGIGAIDRSARGASGSVGSAAGSIAGGFGRIGGSARQAGQDVGQFWIDAHHVLIDLSTVQSQATTDWVNQWEQYQAALRNTQRELEFYRKEVAEASDAGTIQDFFGDITQIAPALQNALGSAVESINKLFAAVRTGGTDVRGLHDGIEIVRQSLIQQGLGELQVNKFIDALINAQTETDTLGNKVINLQHILDSLQDKQITIGVHTDFQVASAATTAATTSANNIAKSLETAADSMADQAKGLGTAFKNTGNAAMGLGTALTTAAKDVGGLASGSANERMTQTDNTPGSGHVGVYSYGGGGGGGIVTQIVPVEGSDTTTGVRVHSYGDDGGTRGGSGGGVQSFLNDNGTGVTTTKFSSSDMSQLSSGFKGVSDAVDRGASRTGDSLSSGFGSTTGGYFDRLGSQLNSGFGGVASALNGLSPDGRGGYTATTTGSIHDIPAGTYSKKFYDEEVAFRDFGSSFGSWAGKKLTFQTSDPAVQNDPRITHYNPMAWMAGSGGSTGQTVNNNGDINISVPVTLVSGSFTGTRTGQQPVASISPQSIAEAQLALSQSVTNAVRQATGR
jgi:hypothetical protein